MKRFLCALLLMISCQQRFFDEPPIHINPNMDVQEKYGAQEETSWFSDERATRAQVPGTISREARADQEAFLLGSVDGLYLEEIPLKVTPRLLQKGKWLFEGTCASCHGEAGYGDGLVFERGMFPPTNLHYESVVRFPVGYIYQAITEGVRDRMPSLVYQLPTPEERWTVVAYTRALQLSQRATRSQIPKQILTERGW